MAGTTTRRFCEHLGSIVRLLEKGDAGAAAAASAELDSIIADLPSSMSDSEMEEARGLLERYRELGDGMQQQLLADMQRLGAARRLRAYGQQGRRP